MEINLGEDKKFQQYITEKTEINKLKLTGESFKQMSLTPDEEYVIKEFLYYTKDESFGVDFITEIFSVADKDIGLSILRVMNLMRYNKREKEKNNAIL